MEDAERFRLLGKYRTLWEETESSGNFSGHCAVDATTAIVAQSGSSSICRNISDPGQQSGSISSILKMVVVVAVPLSSATM